MYKNPLYYLFLIAFSLGACVTQKQHVADADITYLRANDDVEGSDKDIETLVASYRNQVEEEMNTEIGYMPETLKKGKPNSNMGNWFCDALLDLSNQYYDKEVDFALQNYGGLRIPTIPKGNLTKNTIFELMPFDNKLVIINVKGDIVQMICDNMADSNGAPVSHTVSFRIEDDKAVDIKIKGEALDLSKTYIVGLPDYVANGGGGSTFLRGIQQFDTGIFIREGVIQYLEQLKERGEPITINNTKRIY
ncbi:MAG: hypothetical protein HKO66_05665 [Saprospiraceae bacterium]|nr:5'-nucleotidase C-terminal domain-containing protein [Bacteroidia bacterium]NNE14407.1 hypothetical protein [Saprospiraceae bacterium]NNL91697.1 hypothetical protein [Saprospiraceae bacterium]